MMPAAYEQQGKPVYNYPTGESYSYYPSWCPTTTTPTPTGSLTTTTGGVYRNDEDVVISGVSSRFAEQPYPTTVKGYEQFDYGFFGIKEKQAKSMDKYFQALLEVTYESIFDSGFNPMEFKGTKTGVFVGTYGFNNGDKGPLPQYATEISRYFDFTGPTYTVDTTQSSGLVALDNAINSIRNGMCSQAVVATININDPSFYTDHPGTFGVVFLQKRQVAKRFYAKVALSKSMVTPITGEKQFNFSYPFAESFSEFLRQAYTEANVDPNMVTYLDMTYPYGTQDTIYGSNEYKLVTDVFAKSNRTKNPFFASWKKMPGFKHDLVSLVGMLTSMQRDDFWFGHEHKTTDQGGLVALNSFGFPGTSVHIALEPYNEFAMSRYGQKLFWNQDYSQYSKLPRVFHFSSRTEEGLLTALDEMYANPHDLPTQFLLSGHSFTTPTTHPFRGFTILNGQKKTHEFKQWNGVDKRPLWFFFNGLGTQWYGMGKELMQIEYFSTVMYKIAEMLKPYGFDLIQYLMNEDRTTDAYYAAILINAIQIAFVDMMKYMGVQPDGIVGYSIGEFVAAYADNALTLEESVLATYFFAKFIKDTKLPTGSMARVGLSWEEVTRSCPSSIYPSFNMNKEQCVVSGPERAISQYVEQLRARGIQAAELHSFDLGLNSYFMKPVVSQFVTQLQSIIRTPKLRSSKWYSTTYKSEQMPEYAKYASPEYFSYCLMNPSYIYDVIQRVPPNAITLEFGPTPFFEYYLGNTLGQDNYYYVNFVKPNAPSHIEHFWYNFGRLYTEGYNVDAMKLVLPITKQLVYPVPHTTRFLSPLVSWYRPYGKSYNQKYEYNTTSGTSSYMYQEPSTTEFMPKTYENGTYAYTIDPSQNEYEYVKNLVVNGKTTYPIGGYFYLVWMSFSKLLNTPMERLPVSFEDVHFVGGPVFFESSPITFTVRFTDQQTGRFEVMYNDMVIVYGRVFSVPKSTSKFGWSDSYQCEYMKIPHEDFISWEEIYYEFRTRGYDYSNELQYLQKANTSGTAGEINWSGEWARFFDSMIQMYVFGKHSKEWPKYIQSFRINPFVHRKVAKDLYAWRGIYDVEPAHTDDSSDDEYEPVGSARPPRTPTTFMPIFYDQYTKAFVSGGVEMSGVQSVPFATAPYQEKQPMVLERINFVPYFERYTEPQCTEAGEFKPNYEFVDSYLKEINYYMGKILSSITGLKPSFTTIKPSSYDKTFSGYEGTFLKLLKDIYELDPTSDFFRRGLVKLLGGDTFPLFFKTWSEDPFFYFTDGRYNYLKSILQTVYENSRFSLKRKPVLKVLEIAPLMHAFSTKIHEFTNMYPTLHIDYHYVQVDKYQIENDISYEWPKYSKSFSVTKIDWEIGEQAFPSDRYNEFDLVIFNDSVISMNFDTDSEKFYEFFNTFSRDVVKPQGFLLFHEFTSHWETVKNLYRLKEYLYSGKIRMGTFFERANFYNYLTEEQWRAKFDKVFYPIAVKNDNVFSTFFLYRKPYEPVKHVEIMINDATTFDWVEKVKEALEDTSYGRIWLICEQAYTSGLIGFVNSLKHESRGELIRCVFISEPFTAGTWRSNFDAIKRGDLVMNVYKFGKWGSYKSLFDLHDYETSFYFNQPTKYAYVDWSKHGDLSTLQWFQSPKPYVNDTLTHLPINVSYTGLGHRDYLIASGLLHPETLTKYNPYFKNYFGMEFSGYYNDKRYMGITPGYGLSTIISTDKRYLWEIPKDWSLEQASSVPYSYAKAYYGLVVRGGLKNNETVLIHYGATPFGQAAISVALGYNCKVFVTVNSTEERDFLMSLFPGKLGEESFMYLNDKFFDKVMKYTQGNGVNLVLNWYNSDYAPQFYRCMNPYGRFVEFFDYMPTSGQPTYSTPYNKSITYHNVYFDTIFEPENREWSTVYQYVKEGIRTGIVRPLKYTVFDRYKLQEAFQHLVEKKPFEKVLVKIGEQKVKATSRLWFTPNYTYIITGGTYAFALELADWLCERGARKLFISSHSMNVREAYEQRKFEFLTQKYGCSITNEYYNIWKESECVKLVKQAQEMSDVKMIGGVFHLDSPFFKETETESFRKANPETYEDRMCKYTGLYYLDKYLHHPKCYFVVFSSILSGHYNGYPGLESYSYVNSAVERLCELRRLEGNHAVAIQWGPIMSTPDYKTTSKKFFNGLLPQTYSSTFDMLEEILLKSQHGTIWSSYIPQRINESKISNLENWQDDTDYLQYLVWKQTFKNGKFPKPTPTTPYKFVSQLLGVDYFTSLHEPLVNLGLTTTLAGEFKSYLEKYFNVSYRIETIQQWTVDKMMEILSPYTRTPYPYYPPQPYTSTTPTYVVPYTPETSTYQYVYNVPPSTTYHYYPSQPAPTGYTYTTATTTTVPTGYTYVYTPTYPYSNNSTPTSDSYVEYPETVIPKAERGMPHSSMGYKYSYLMPTRVFEKLNDVELTKNITPVFVVHPIEGHVKMLKNWAKQMKYPIYGIQYTPDAFQYDSIESLADYYLRQIDRVTPARFHLVGYSFGGSVAFEMASKKTERIASLTFLDGGCVYLSPYSNRYQAVHMAKDQAFMESEFLYAFVSHYIQGFERQEFLDECRQFESFDERIKFAAKYLRENATKFTFHPYDVEMAAKGYVKRMLMSYKYQPKSFLNYKNVFLVRPYEPSEYTKIFGDDYGLSKWIKGNFTTKMISGDYRTFFGPSFESKLTSAFDSFFSKCN